MSENCTFANSLKIRRPTKSATVFTTHKIKRTSRPAVELEREDCGEIVLLKIQMKACFRMVRLDISPEMMYALIQNGLEVVFVVPSSSIKRKMKLQCTKIVVKQSTINRRFNAGESRMSFVSTSL